MLESTLQINKGRNLLSANPLLFHKYCAYVLALTPGSGATALGSVKVVSFFETDPLPDSQTPVLSLCLKRSQPKSLL
jgi:hypothetical protein